jgi:hypothetical protein
LDGLSVEGACRAYIDTIFEPETALAECAKSSVALPSEIALTLTAYRPEISKASPSGPPSMPGATELDLTAGKSPREALQALIQAEIKRQGAVDFANRTLGPIAEEFLRIVEIDGSARYEVIDGIGELRTHGSSSDALPFTIADLVAELRTRHPTLFEPRATNASGRAAPKPLHNDPGLPSSGIAPPRRQDAFEPPHFIVPLRKRRVLPSIGIVLATLGAGWIAGVKTPDAIDLVKVYPAGQMLAGLRAQLTSWSPASRPYPPVESGESGAASAIERLNLKLNEIRAGSEGTIRDVRTTLGRLNSLAEGTQQILMTKLEEVIGRLDRIERNGSFSAELLAKADNSHAGLPIDRSRVPGLPPEHSPAMKGKPAKHTSAQPRAPLPMPKLSASSAKAATNPPLQASVPPIAQKRTERPQTLGEKAIADWHIYEVVEDTAILRGPRGLIAVSAGDIIPGLGRVQSIVRRGGRWIVATAKGTIGAH